MSQTFGKVYKRSHEPIFWGLFGAGGMLTAFISPAMILITGILVPLGFLGHGILSYEKIHTFATSWYGAIVLFILIALPLWHTLHRIYHGLHDLGMHKGRDIQQVLCYGFAFAVSVFVGSILLQMA
jgi:fumarate reductase subunit D